ncbi:MAG: polysaccharide biosynthesis C-terminal domain-containing protein [Lewinellaceae bacterium]|nr:polysaccharide biosynthesis C-terminal domain-containing protein [Lewinellaceae bacterium]
MGIIFRQSAKSTLVNLAATFMGFISLVFIYPYNFEYYSIFQAIFSNAYIILPFLGLGINGAIIKFYPIFREKSLDKELLPFFLLLASITTIVGTLILGLIYVSFKSALFHIFPNLHKVESHWLMIIVMAWILNFSIIFLYYCNAKLRIVIPDLLYNASLKFVLPILILLSYLWSVSLDTFKTWILIYYVLILVLLIVYAINLDSIKWKVPKSLDKSLKQSILNFMGYSTLNGLGATLALRIDMVMIGAMLNLESVGVYAYLLTISNVMDLPSKSLNQISAPVISKNWTENDIKNIQDVYTKSAILGGAISMGLFLLIYAVWPYVLDLIPSGKIPEGLLNTGIILLILGMARVIDIITGVNNLILSYSKLYKYNLYFLLFLAAINITMNYFLIKDYGMVGAATSTLVSYFIYNVIKYIFVRHNFGFKLPLNPIAGMMLWFSACIILMSKVHLSFHPILNIMIIGTFISILFGIGIWILNPYNLIQDLVKDTLKNLNIFQKK